MTDQPIPMSVLSPAIEEAWLHLAGAIAADVFDEITIGEAAELLVDVYPPYPPAAFVERTVPQRAAVLAARVALRRAAADAATAEEQLRVARVLRLLRDLDRDP